MEDPELKLQGENLAYYRNIQYLKELTSQATSLLSRSNAVYTNILTDVEMAKRVRGLSDSTGSHSLIPDHKCGTCGLYHGVKFCIVDHIDKEEKSWAERSKMRFSLKDWRDVKKEPSISQSKDSEGIVSKVIEEHSKTPVKTETPLSLDMDNRSPDEILTTYEALCARFGSSSGRRYLLATSLKEEKQPWVEKPPVEKIIDEKVDHLKIEYREREIECAPERPPLQHQVMCPLNSEDIEKKLEEEVLQSPQCCEMGVVNKPKRWRDILCRPGRASDHREVFVQPVEVIEKQKIDYQLVVCKCGAMDCECGGKDRCIIPPAREVCQLVDEECNYISTIRSKMERRRQARERRRISSTVFLKHQSIASKRKISQNFTLLAHAEVLKILDNCVGNKLTPSELESLKIADSSELEAPKKKGSVWDYRKNIEALAELVAPSSMIPAREWNVWYDNYQSAHVKGSDDDADSVDSDIQTSVSVLSENLSELDYKERPLPPSCIPYAAETYNLINRLFDKISMKLEKSVKKSTRKMGLDAYRSIFAFRFRKLSLLKAENEIFREIFNDIQQPYFWPKSFVPFAVRRRLKINRMSVITTKYKRALKRRALIERVEQGKRVKLSKDTKKYTKEGGYLGFTPKKRKLLRTIESKRFASSNWAGDAGRKITKKTIHDDYRLLTNLFDEPSSSLRMSLLDKEIKKRMDIKKIYREYGEPTLPEPPECASAHDVSTSEDVNQMRKKPERQEVRFVRSEQKQTKSEKQTYGAVRSDSAHSNFNQTRNHGSTKSCYTFDQPAIVRARQKSPRQVSQNVLLGSNRDTQTKDAAGSNLKEESVKNSGEPSSDLKSTDAANSSAADTGFPPPPPPSLQKKSSLLPSTSPSPGTRQPSRDTPVEPRFFSSNRLNAAGKGSATALPFSSRSIKSKNSSTLGSKVLSGGPSGTMGSKMNFSEVSSIMDETAILVKGRVLSQSLIAEPGSRMMSQRGILGDNMTDVTSQMQIITQTASNVIDQPAESQVTKKHKPKPRDKPSDLLSDMSLTRLRRMKPSDRLGPTKKRVFGIDIGQGINYIQYLRDSAGEADEDKKEELLNLMTVPREKRRATPGKPVSSKTELQTESQQGSFNRETESPKPNSSRKARMSLVGDASDSTIHLKNQPIKTLDQIYKEVHGINKRNTPAPLVENEYEHEMMKKQQLRKHKIL